MKEAAITVNGHTLTVGEAMTVRVALTDFLFQIAQPGALGHDYHGIYMRTGYRDCSKAVLRLMALDPPTTFPKDGEKP